MIDQAEQAARNLLHHCAVLEAGERLLILYEDPALGWYDNEAGYSARLADLVAKV